MLYPLSYGGQGVTTTVAGPAGGPGQRVSRRGRAVGTAGRRGAGPPWASRPHGASVAIRCEVPRSVRRCKRAPRAQSRTGRWTRHRAWPPPAGRCGAGPPRTSRPHRASVASRCEVPCSVRRCNRAPRAQPRTRRRTRHGAWPLSTGGAVLACHGPPVRTVRPSRSRARFRVPCGAASAHHARNLAPDGGPRTVPARPRQPAGVAVADAYGCSAARTASTTGCAPPGSVNSVDCAVIQYGSAKASARPTSPLRAK